ncbi:MAG: tRNA pseudouridine(13) synthase TruD [Euryarchaeota archaeon]|nr:tRNA pseudouridine(13) synthase TruD [Euryarchaeota archaeon]
MSPLEIEESLGLVGWSVEDDGVGGLLKVRVEDFRVEEVSKVPALDPKGRFTVARVTLHNWETNRLLNRLAKSCGISRNRIFASGLKDKRAVTTQILVIDAPQKRVSEVTIPDCEIEILGRTHQKVGMSDHDGNRFTITVRGCCYPDGSPMDGKEALMRVQRIRKGLGENLGADVFPNWIGPQRFGANRPVTPMVGRAVVEGDFESAVDLYLGMAGNRSGEETASFRKMWRETRDPVECLGIIPKHLGYERDMLSRLSEDGSDWLGAFKSLPHSLQLLTIHSLQSLAFNHALSRRISSGLSLIEPSIGDIVAPLKSNGRIDVSKMAYVSETNLDRCRRNCNLGRLSLTGPLPGSDANLADGEPGSLERKALVDTALESTDWNVKKIRRLSSSGTRRPLCVPFSDFSVEEATEIPPSAELSKRWEDQPSDGERWNPEGASLRLVFTLPPGTYATVLMREFMRSPLDHY